MKRRLFLLASIGLLGTPVWAESRERRIFEKNLLPDTPVVGEPGWALSARQKHYRVPGLQVAVLKQGKLLWDQGYGWTDTKNSHRVTSRTLFDAGSISKAVTAVGVARLVDQGRLSLDVPVNTFLRSWHLPDTELTMKTPVTLRHLLMHTAGVNVGGFWGYLESEPQPTLLQILDGKSPAANAPIRVEGEPGKSWRYSGGGYVIVQQVLEDVTGKPFAQCMDELVFAPLGMTRSTFVQGLPQSLRGDVASPSSEASYFKGRRLHPHAAAAGLYTTATDLALLLGALYTAYHKEPQAFLSYPVARQLMEPGLLDREPWDRAQLNRRNTQKDQALGWMRISRNGAPQETKYLYHDGLNAGFRSRAMLDPESGDGLVVLYNSDGDEEFLLELTRAAAFAHGWKDWIDAPIKPASLTTQELDQYVGRYRRGPDNIVTITRQGNHLRWVDLYTASQPIYPIGGDRFEHQALFGRSSVFRRDAQNRIIDLDGWPRQPEDAPTLPMEYLIQGKLAAGRAALKADTTLTPPRLYEIGFNFLETHRLPQAAIAAFSAGVEKFPAVPGGWDALGDALKRAGDKAAGERAEQRAEALRVFQQELLKAFSEGGVGAGEKAFTRLRKRQSDLPFHALVEWVAGRLREQGKLPEADAAGRLAV